MYESFVTVPDGYVTRGHHVEKAVPHVSAAFASRRPRRWKVVDMKRPTHVAGT